MNSFAFTTGPSAPKEMPHSCLTAELGSIEKSIETARNLLSALGVKLQPIMVPPSQTTNAGAALSSGPAQSPVVVALQNLDSRIREISAIIDEMTNAVAI